jgi:hypothetical protein
LIIVRKWVRWQDWSVLVVGLYAVLSPVWTTTSRKATTTLIVLGVLAAAAALWSLAVPELVAAETTMAVLGVLFFVAPWVVGFTASTGMARTAWVVGVVTFVLGGWELLVSKTAHHQQLHPQT